MSELESLKRTYVGLLTAAGVKGDVRTKVEMDLSRLHPGNDPAEYLTDCINCILLVNESLEKDAPVDLIVQATDAIINLRNKYEPIIMNEGTFPA